MHLAKRIYRLGYAEFGFKQNFVPLTFTEGFTSKRAAILLKSLLSKNDASEAFPETIEMGETCNFSGNLQTAAFLFPWAECSLSTNIISLKVHSNLQIWIL